MKKKTLATVISIITILIIFSSISYAATPQEWLKFHNEYRCRHGVPKLKWSATRAKDAQDSADQCAYPDPHCVNHEGSWSENWDPSETPKGAVADWYSEIESYDYDNPQNNGSSGEITGTGHFITLVDKNITEVGCASSSEGSWCVYTNQKSIYGVLKSPVEYDSNKGHWVPRRKVCTELIKGGPFDDDIITSYKDLLWNGSHVKIRNYFSLKCMDIGSKENGSIIKQWDGHGGANQRFSLETHPYDSQYWDSLLTTYNAYGINFGHAIPFIIKADWSGKVADVAGYGYKLKQWDFHGMDNQIFRFHQWFSSMPWMFTIQNLKTGQCLALGDLYSNGIQLVQKDCVTLWFLDISQWWTIEP